MDASGFLIGSNTVNGDALPQVWNLLSRLSPISHGDKVAMVFGSYGWSGEAVPGIENRSQGPAHAGYAGTAGKVQTG